MARARFPWPLLLPLLGSCNDYDLVLHDRFAQGSFNSKVDIVWVVDNSESMADIQAAVQENFDSFIDAFAGVSGDQGQDFDYDTVFDATVAWAEFTLNQETFLNYRMGVTTTDLVGGGNGERGNLRSAGALGGNACAEPAMVTPQTEDAVGVFNALVDVGTAGTGDETGLRAAALALCKGKDAAWWAELPNLADDDPVKLICGDLLNSGQESCNQSFFRQDASTVVIIVTDEGDGDHASTQHPPQAAIDACLDLHAEDPFFTQCDCRIEWYLEFFENIGQPVVFANIGPTYQAPEDPVIWCDGTERSIQGPCNRFASSPCGIDFYQRAACETFGLFTPIEVRAEGAATCDPADFETALTAIGELISGLTRSFVLSAVPDPATISVFRNGEEVPAASGSSAGGWRYVPSERAIAFSGDTGPGPDESIDVYYLPLFDRRDQVGRDLPF